MNTQRGFNPPGLTPNLPSLLSRAFPVCSSPYKWGYSPGAPAVSHGISWDKNPPWSEPEVIPMADSWGWAKLELSSAIGSGSGEEKEGLKPRDNRWEQGWWEQGGKAPSVPRFLGIQGKRGR